MRILQVERIMHSDRAGARLPHEQRYANGAAFVNGIYTPVAEATIPILDMGFLQSDAVYEKITVAKGRYFRMQDHFERFANSCRKFCLRNPYSNEQMVQIFSHLLSLTGLQDAGVFWCVTRGLARKVSDRGNPDCFENRFYAIVDGYGSIATEEQRNRGLDLMVSRRYLRIDPRAVDAHAKNFHWMDMKLALFEAREHGKDWAVLTDADGFLTEAPGANIFVIKNGALYTPDSGCLEGITARCAIELAQMLGVDVHVARVHADELRQADDAFITSSAGGIMPINRVDGIVLGGVEGPGELSVRIHNLYWEKLWEGWKCTAVNYASAAQPHMAQLSTFASPPSHLDDV